MVSPPIIPVIGVELTNVPGVALSNRTRLLFALLMPKIGSALADVAATTKTMERARRREIARWLVKEGGKTRRRPRVEDGCIAFMGSPVIPAFPPSWQSSNLEGRALSRPIFFPRCPLVPKLRLGMLLSRQL